MKNYKCIQDIILGVKNIKDKGIIFIHGSDDKEFISYKELYTYSMNMLFYLKSKDLNSGDNLIILLEDPKEFIISFWACILGGIIPVPVSNAYNDEQRLKILKIWRILKNKKILLKKSKSNILKKYIINNYDNKYNDLFKDTIFIDDFKPEKLCDDIYISKLDETAFIQFSSGSTADPKGIILTHENILTNLYDILEGAEGSEEDISLSWLPLTHDMGLFGFHLAPICKRFTHIIMPTSLFVRNPVLWMDIANEYKATVLASPNFGYQYFLNVLSKKRMIYDWDLSNIRLIFNGAEPISYEICNNFINELKKYNLKENVIFPVYGLAEATLAVTFPPINEKITPIYIDRFSLQNENKVNIVNNNSNSISFIDLGSPVKNCNIRICDSDGNVVDELIIGHIQIKGKNVTNGYYNELNIQEKKLNNDSWIDTGDLGFIKDKRLIVTGRARDILFVNGYNLFAHDIERVIEKENNINTGNVAAVAVNNDTLKKDNLVVFILYKKKIEDFILIIQDIKNTVNKYFGIEIKSIIPVKKFPQTTSGKIKRYKLQEMYMHEEYSFIENEIEIIMEDTETNVNVYESPTNDMEKYLIGIWEEILGIEKIGILDNFFQLGGDSLTAIKIINRVKVDYDYDLDMSKLFANPIIKVIADEINKAISKRNEIEKILYKIE